MSGVGLFVAVYVVENRRESPPTYSIHATRAAAEGQSERVRWANHCAVCIGRYVAACACREGRQCEAHQRAHAAVGHTLAECPLRGEVVVEEREIE